MGTGGGSHPQSAARVLRGVPEEHGRLVVCIHLHMLAYVCMCVCQHSSSFYFIAKETGGDVLSRPATGVSRGVSGKSFLSTTAYRIQPAAVGSKGGRGKPVLSTAGHGSPQGDSGTLSIVCVCVHMQLFTAALFLL